MDPIVAGLGGVITTQVILLHTVDRDEKGRLFIDKPQERLSQIRNSELPQFLLFGPVKHLCKFFSVGQFQDGKFPQQGIIGGEGQWAKRKGYARLRELLCTNRPILCRRIEGLTQCSVEVPFVIIVHKRVYTIDQDKWGTERHSKDVAYMKLDKIII